MINLTPTVALIEVLWTGVCTVTLGICLIRFHNAMIDRAVALNRRARLIAARNVRAAGGRSWRQCVFALIGVRAMTQPPPVTPLGSWTAAAVGVAFISLAVFDLVDASLDIREQQMLLDWRSTQTMLSRMFPTDEDRRTG